MKYETYLAKVEAALLSMTGNEISVSDLPDVVDIGEHYYDETPPRVVAAQILAENGGEELIDPDDIEMMEELLGFIPTERG